MEHHTTARITLDASFNEALMRLAAARRTYEVVRAHHASFADRIDALDLLNESRLEMIGIRTGLGLEV